MNLSRSEQINVIEHGRLEDQDKAYWPTQQFKSEGQDRKLLTQPFLLIGKTLNKVLKNELEGQGRNILIQTCLFIAKIKKKFLK